MPTVLVTGAAGGLGSAISNQLLESGLNVKCFIRPQDSPGRLRVSGGNIVRGFIEDRDKIFQALEGVDIAINCAALLPNVRHLGYHAFRRVNVEGAVNVLSQAALRGLKLVILFSTISVVDHTDSQIRWPDIRNYVTDKNDPYLRSKVEMEQEIERVSHSYSGSVVVIRPAFVYGPGNFAVWSDAISLLKKSKMVLLDQGQAMLPVVYSEDIANFILHIIKEKLPQGVTTTIISGRERTTMREIFDYLAVLLHARPPRTAPSWIAYALASAVEVIPERLRRGRLRLLTKHRVLQYSKGYDLSGVLDPPPFGFVCQTGYRAGFREMIKDAKI
jgi:nucleoside-diphosphate-sugar epimerase